MTKLKRHVADRHGITKELAPGAERRSRHGRSRTAGEDDLDRTRRAKITGHGHPREERRSATERAWSGRRPKRHGARPRARDTCPANV